MLPPALLAPILVRLSATLGRNVAESTPGRALRAELAGRSFAIVIDGLELRVRVQIDSEAINLTADDEPADAEVRGAPFALLATLRAGNTSGGGVSITGDAEIAQRFEALLTHARPDLEAELARRIGEAPAEFAARAARGLGDFARRLRSTALGSVGEYLTEESRDLPARGEAEAYVTEVDRVRDGVERADVRLKALEERLRARQG